MTDYVAEILSEIASIAGSLGVPVDINPPYEPNEDELPVVVVYTGEEIVIEEDGMPAADWSAFWSLNPEIRVLVRRDDPMDLHADLTEKWGVMRAAIENNRLLDLIRPGTKPGLRKLPILDQEKPGIAGFVVQFDLDVER